MSHLIAVEPLQDGLAVRLQWADSYSARFHAIWLRDNALDAETRSAANGQRLITLADIPDATRIASIAVQGDRLEIHFTPENKTVVFSADWLRTHVYDHPDSAQPGWLGQSIATWDGTLDVTTVSDDFIRVSRDADALRQWLAHVRRYGFAKLTGGPLESGALFQIAALFGYVRETNYGRCFEVRSELNPSNLAYTGLGLQAHTDNPYRDPTPTLQILYCLQSSVQGGDSQVVDGFCAAQRLQNDHPRDFELLSKYCARFDYHGGGTVHLTARRPMIELAPDGELIAIRFNSRSVAPITDVPFDEMADYYRAYRRFSDIIDNAGMAVSFKLQPGECFIVDNTRVLHGRTGFADSGGSRWLQGCYADKDGLLSTLSVLESTA